MAKSEQEVFGGGGGKSGERRRERSWGETTATKLREATTRPYWTAKWEVYPVGSGRVTLEEEVN
jgi:hypothetical protein